jgi:cytochrome c oxidase assembly protein subunit 11
MSDTEQVRQARTGRRNSRMLGKLLLIAVLMFGFGYSLVPLYKKICELTGINVLAVQETLNSRVANTQVDASRWVTVEFVANTSGPWRFKPLVASIEVHPGEMAQVSYEVLNMQGRAMEAQAIPSYAPQEAGQYFKKLECFCFKQQTLGANELRRMPVSFFIDPALPKSVKTITLSYTFFEVGAKRKVSLNRSEPNG